MYYLSLCSKINDFEFKGSLDEAMEKADRLACYTKEDIIIYADNNRDNLVALRRWHDYCADEDALYRDIINFGIKGYYDEWYIAYDNI